LAIPSPAFEQILPTRQQLRSQVCPFGAVALTAQDLEVINRRAASQRNWNDVVVLNVEGRATLSAATAITLEHGTLDLAWDVFATTPRLLLNVQHKVRPFKAALFASLSLTHEREDILGAIPARLPVEHPFEPPPASSR
jgi:alkylhydroperoxidase family enzyme